MFIKGYTDVRIDRSGVRSDDVCDKRFGAYFKFKTDVQELFPLITETIKSARHYAKPAHVRFNYKKVACTLYHKEVMAIPFRNHRDAFVFIKDLLDFLNDLYEKRHVIKPNFKVCRQKPSVVDILKTLPQSNCGHCSFKTCLAFAAALRVGKTYPDMCPDFPDPISRNVEYPVIGQDGNLLSTFSVETGSMGKKKNTEKIKKENQEQKQVLCGITDAKKPLYDQFGNRIQKSLTKREIQVLRHLAGGSTNSEISDMLSISPNTVKSHVVHIFNKVSANDRTQAAVWAVRNGVI